jgi:hypothetical protein
MTKISMQAINSILGRKTKSDRLDSKSDLGLHSSKMAKTAATRLNKRGATCATRLLKQLPVRLSVEEYEWVIATAKSEGRPAANFMRHRILQGKESR